MRRVTRGARAPGICRCKGTGRRAASGSDAGAKHIRLCGFRVSAEVVSASGRGRGVDVRSVARERQHGGDEEEFAARGGG